MNFLGVLGFASYLLGHLGEVHLSASVWLCVALCGVYARVVWYVMRDLNAVDVMSDPP